MTQGEVRDGSIASIERRPWHVGFTPDSGRIVASQRTDVMGQRQTSSEHSASAIFQLPTSSGALRLLACNRRRAELLG